MERPYIPPVVAHFLAAVAPSHERRERPRPRLKAPERSPAPSQATLNERRTAIFHDDVRFRRLKQALIDRQPDAREELDVMRQSMTDMPPPWPLRWMQLFNTWPRLQRPAVSSGGRGPAPAIVRGMVGRGLIGGGQAPGGGNGGNGGGGMGGAA